MSFLVLKDSSTSTPKSSLSGSARGSASTASSSAEELWSCIVCCEAEHHGDEDGPFTAPCGHDFCANCITSYVERCIKDESVFPLQCCQQPITPDALEHFISPILLRILVRKISEYQVPARDRVYCSNGDCASFLGRVDGPGVHQKEKSCAVCPQRTCVQCKGRAHGGEECPVDRAENAFKSICGQAGWKTCPACGAVIERSGGCNHITCRCKGEFCYDCVKVWNGPNHDCV